MKILTFTTLYPNSVQTRHGIFVEQRLRHLSGSGKVQSKTIAPVPWFPFRHSQLGRYSEFARVPAFEHRYGIEVLHPRYPLIPKIGMNPAPLLLALAVKPTFKAVLDRGYDFDIIDAHYFYPDGVAAVILGRLFKKPVTITARGNDLSLITHYRIPRKMIKWAAEQAAGLITVCSALKTVLIDLGIDSSRVHVLRNGVDLDMFCPVDRQAQRGRLNIHRPTLLSVGHLIERKGNEFTIQALPLLPDFQLLLIGDGPEEKKLKQLAAKLNVSDRVHFLGPCPQDQLRDYYNAADILVLASSREGWANVLLESMACGTPVVATSIWGTPEVVTAPEAGRLVAERTPLALAEAIRDLWENYPDRNATRRYAEGFTWDETTEGQIALFESVLNNSGMVYS